MTKKEKKKNLRFQASTNKLKNLIEYNLTYTEISKNFRVTNNKIINLHNSKYSSTGAYKFPYDYESATVIVNASSSFLNIFDLLTSDYF
jgi:hypothetical protein